MDTSVSEKCIRKPDGGSHPSVIDCYKARVSGDHSIAAAVQDRT
ncbi:hypothetical protein [Acetobacter sicerae]|nr:hypothetical protein [Acetobacter sicerae]